MRKISLAVLLSIAFVSIVSSCARLMPSPPPEAGEVRLTKIQLPDSIQEGVPYKVVVEFKSEGEPQIVGACFRWTDEIQQRRLPDLYCFMANETTDQPPLWGSCSKWTNKGQFGVTSQPVCTEVKDVTLGVRKPGSFTTTLEPRNAYFIYKNIEVYAKYLRAGQIVETNRIYAPVSIHQK